MTRLNLWMLCAALAACSASDISATPSVITPANLDGDWWRVGLVPGSTEHWQLTMSGNAVTGTGTWTGEACCSGPVVISGSAAGDSLHVDVVLTSTVQLLPTRTYHFDGALMADTLLVGAGSTPQEPNQLRKGVQNVP